MISIHYVLSRDGLHHAPWACGGWLMNKNRRTSAVVPRSLLKSSKFLGVGVVPVAIVAAAWGYGCGGPGPHIDPCFSGPGGPCFEGDSGDAEAEGGTDDGGDAEADAGTDDGSVTGSDASTTDSGTTP